MCQRIFQVPGFESQWVPLSCPCPVAKIYFVFLYKCSQTGVRVARHYVLCEKSLECLFYSVMTCSATDRRLKLLLKAYPWVN